MRRGSQTIFGDKKFAHNLCGSLDTTTELFDTATLGFQHFENYCTGTLAASGTILPAIE